MGPDLWKSKKKKKKKKSKSNQSFFEREKSLDMGRNFRPMATHPFKNNLSSPRKKQNKTKKKQKKNKKKTLHNFHLFGADQCIAARSKI